MEIRYIIRAIMHHIKETKYLQETGNVYSKYIPAPEKGGVSVLIDYEQSKYIYMIMLNIYRKKDFKVYTHYAYVDGEVITASNVMPEMDINVYINPDKEPYNYNYLVSSLYEVLTHEFEHIFQDDFNKKPNKPNIDSRRKKEIASNPNKMYLYYLMDHEIFPLIKGLKRKAKYNKTSFEQELEEFINIQLELNNINSDKILYVKKKILDYYGRIYV
jgi:hypothetical protein